MQTEQCTLSCHREELTLLSSSTVFKFSIQIASTGPSRTIQVFWFLFLAALKYRRGLLCRRGKESLRQHNALGLTPYNALTRSVIDLLTAHAVTINKPAPEDCKDAICPITSCCIHASKHLRCSYSLGVHAPDDMFGSQLGQGACQDIHNGCLASTTWTHEHNAMAHLQV